MLSAYGFSNIHNHPKTFPSEILLNAQLDRGSEAPKGLGYNIYKLHDISKRLIFQFSLVALRIEHPLQWK